MNSLVKFKIETDTGLSSLHVWPENKLPQSQDDMRQAIKMYGVWIYSDMPEARAEYHNYWLPKLSAAKEFTLKVVES